MKTKLEVMNDENKVSPPAAQTNRLSLLRLAGWLGGQIDWFRLR